MGFWNAKQFYTDNHCFCMMPVDYNFLFSELMRFINPLFMIPKFYENTYILFFILSAGLFAYHFFRNKKLIQHIKNLYRKTSLIAKILLSLIILMHIANSIYSMQPLNNLQPPNLHDIYEAHKFATEYGLNRLIQPSGFPVLVAFSKIIFGVDYIYIYSGLGILFSSLTVIFLFFILKH